MTTLRRCPIALWLPIRSNVLQLSSWYSLVTQFAKDSRARVWTNKWGRRCRLQWEFPARAACAARPPVCGKFSLQATPPSSFVRPDSGSRIFGKLSDKTEAACSPRHVHCQCQQLESSSMETDISVETGRGRSLENFDALWSLGYTRGLSKSPKVLPRLLSNWLPHAKWVPHGHPGVHQGALLSLKPTVPTYSPQIGWGHDLVSKDNDILKSKFMFLGPTLPRCMTSLWPSERSPQKHLW